MIVTHTFAGASFIPTHQKGSPRHPGRDESVSRPIIIGISFTPGGLIIMQNLRRGQIPISMTIRSTISNGRSFVMLE